MNGKEDSINDIEKECKKNEEIDIESKWTRNCPKCGKILYYSLKRSLIRATKRNTKCRECYPRGRDFALFGIKRTNEVKEKIKKALIGKTCGKNNSFYGRHHSKEMKEMMHAKMKEKYANGNHPCIGKRMSEETKEKIRKKLIGKNSPFYGKHPSEETREKLRKIRLNRVTPNFNPEACKIIDEYGKANGYNFQHAMNGGEVHASGYSIDGYDKEKNTVIEYYENHHLKTKERDEHPKQRIIRCLKCKFIEIKEWESDKTK